jgi:Protein of unknown function (DUF3016)
MSSFTRYIPLSAAILIAAGCQSPLTPVPNDGRVTVTYDQPEKFTDVRSSYQGGTDQGYLDDLARYIDRVARGYLADGQRLTIKFTDIDMAGDFQPGRSRLSDVRIIRPTYPPRLKFSYTVTDASGHVVGQGDEKLADTTFQSRFRSSGDSDPLTYEKGMLKDWMSTTLHK